MGPKFLDFFYIITEDFDEKLKNESLSENKLEKMSNHLRCTNDFPFHGHYHPWIQAPYHNSLDPWFVPNVMILTLKTLSLQSILPVLPVKNKISRHH